MNHLSPREQTMFDLLQDERSRQIFLARKHFAETGENADLWRLIDHPPEFEKTMGKLRSVPYVLYGAGAVCRKLVPHLRAMGVIDNCRGIWDRNPEKNNTEIDGVRVGFPDPKSDFTYVLPAVSEKFSPALFSEILEYLKMIGVADECLIKPYFTILENPDAYFDDAIIKSRLGSDEVFVDGGAYDFWTSRRFIEICGSENIKAVHAFEPDERLFNISRENSRKYPFATCHRAGLWSETTELNFRPCTPSGSLMLDREGDMKIRVVDMDSYLPPDQTISFIKFDIEGAEFEALKGAAKIIARDKPKLAICVYHKSFDYIELPEYIHSLVPEYRMYLRIYGGGGGDTVLYCIAPLEDSAWNFPKQR